jgi:hypothetical protein
MLCESFLPALIFEGTIFKRLSLENSLDPLFDYLILDVHYPFRLKKIIGCFYFALVLVKFSLCAFLEKQKSFFLQLFEKALGLINCLLYV